MFDLTEGRALNEVVTLAGPHAERVRNCFETLRVILASDQKQGFQHTNMHMRFPHVVESFISGDPLEGRDAVVVHPCTITWLRMASREALMRQYEAALGRLKQAEQHALLGLAL